MIVLVVEFMKCSPSHLKTHPGSALVYAHEVINFIDLPNGVAIGATRIRTDVMEETALSAVTLSVVEHSQQSTQPESYHFISDEQPQTDFIFSADFWLLDVYYNCFTYVFIYFWLNVFAINWLTINIARVVSRIFVYVSIENAGTRLVKRS